MDYGRETITLFEIDQPLCRLSYGVSPCQAAIGTTGTRKCYNTRFTCQDPANYTPTQAGSPTVPNLLTLRFAFQQEGLLPYGPLIPSMTALTTTPASINLAAMDRNVSALGSREVVSIKLDDHRYSDHLVDPYRLERLPEAISPLTGGNVTIDDAAAANTARGMRAMWFVTADIGYFFFIDADNDFKYAKTLNGGRSWRAPVTIYSGTVQAFDTLWDQFVPGRTGSKIHLFYTAQDQDDVHYNYLDTSGDTLGTARTVFNGATANSGGGRFCTGTITRTGVLWCAFNIDAGAETGTRSSADQGITWEVRTNFYEAFPDIVQLYPGNEEDRDDVWALYYDDSASEVSLKVYDNDANTIFDTDSYGAAGTTVVVAPSTDGVYQYPFSGTVRHSDGHVLFVKSREYDTVNGDVHMYDIAGSGSGQLNLQPFICDNVDDVYYPFVFVDNATDTAYVGYIGTDDGSEDIGVAAGVYFKTLAPGASAFSAQQHFSAGVGPWRQLWGPPLGPRFIMAWRDASSQALISNFDNSISFETDADSFDPYQQGTFWGKWLARNPYHAGSYRCRVYEGFLGDAVADMRCRNYIIDRIEGPTDGQVTLIAKDFFSVIEAQKAVAPTASRGELSADLAAAHGIGSPTGTFTLLPAGIGDLDYPASGSPPMLHVAIGDEIIACTRSGDVFTILERGALNTVAADHDQEDLVQLVLSYDTELAVDIVHDLLLNYTSLEAADLPKAQWDIAAAQLTSLYTAHIAAPTPVAELAGELAEQAGFTLWPDVESGQIQFAALRRSATGAAVDDDAWIVEESLSLKRRTDKRASQVWVYYGQISPVEDLDDPQNFRSRIVTVPGENLYEAEAIREVFSRWIPQFGRSAAEACGERILAMFRDPPLEARFKLHIGRDGALGPARLFTLETADVQDDIGDMLPVTMATVELQRGENELAVRAQQVAFAEPASEAEERVIFIENDAFNLNLRTVHDSLYAAPLGGSPGESVRFVVIDGVTVGSTSTATPAMQTGSWPSGVSLTLQNRGRIQGMAGAGGAGSKGIDGAIISHGAQGSPGGTALKATYALLLDNDDGEIWGGGGGGGGGASRHQPGLSLGGGGGGGGSGTNSGPGGAAGTGNPGGTPAVAGSAGTATVGGTGGAGQIAGANNGGEGGAGGDPGQNGQLGGLGTGLLTSSVPGGGGSAGKYIDGIAFVTMGSPTGDLRGLVS